VNITLITKAAQAAAATLAEMAGIIPPGYGAVTLDKQAYKPGDLAGITLYDSDLNTNPGVADPAQVTALRQLHARELFPIAVLAGPLEQFRRQLDGHGR
jgi:hypothetical protein